MYTDDLIEFQKTRIPLPPVGFVTKRNRMKPGKKYFQEKVTALKPGRGGGGEGTGFRGSNAAKTLKKETHGKKERISLG